VIFIANSPQAAANSDSTAFALKLREAVSRLNPTEVYLIGRLAS